MSLIYQHQSAMICCFMPRLPWLSARERCSGSQFELALSNLGLLAYTATDQGS